MTRKCMTLALDDPRQTHTILKRMHAHIHPPLLCSKHSVHLIFLKHSATSYITSQQEILYLYYCIYTAVFILLYLYCCIYTAVFILLYLYCCIYTAVFILLYLYCCIYTAVFILLRVTAMLQSHSQQSNNSSIYGIFFSAN